MLQNQKSNFEYPAPNSLSEENSPTDFALQSTPKHVAIIMDGNRRWARERELPPAEGHRMGLEQLISLLPAFRHSDIEVLTLFGFASANWQRDKIEVANLLRLADQAVRRFAPVCIREDLRVKVIGRRDRLPSMLVKSIEITERATLRGSRTLRIALDYSSREAIVAAAHNSRDFSTQMATCSDVDLLIRTGKEQRLSDFLLWECAFAELYFPDLYWPEFSEETLITAISWYQQRNRRFGS